MRYKNTDALPVKEQAKSEYIKRADAIEALTGWETDPTDEEIEFALNKIPTADVVEVVRCKDCAVPHNSFIGCPHLNGLVPPPDHFCARGERREK